MKGIVYFSKCLEEQPDFFAQGTDVICVRMLSFRP